MNQPKNYISETIPLGKFSLYVTDRVEYGKKLAEICLVEKLFHHTSWMLHQYYNEILKDMDFILFGVVFDRGNVIASSLLVISRIEFKSCSIDIPFINIYVRKKYRRQGIGSQLITAFQKTLIGTIGTIYYLDGIRGSVDFYEANGLKHLDQGLIDVVINSKSRQ